MSQCVVFFRVLNYVVVVYYLKEYIEDEFIRVASLSCFSCLYIFYFVVYIFYFVYYIHY